MIKKWIACLMLIICSILYDYRHPIQKEQKTISRAYVILEGEFLKTGKYEFDRELTVKELVDIVGVSKQASLSSLNMEYIVKDESSLYLPKKKKDMISLNHASKTELMTLKGVGEKTALKIIEYRRVQPFECLEDIQNISGIGEKTYKKFRDVLCL